MKLTSTLVGLGAALALTAAIAPRAAAASFADFLFVVDESGSMYGEHAWLGEVIDDLEASLLAKGVGASAEANRYGLVGFGGYPMRRTLPVGGADFGNASEFALATRQLHASGYLEDGYAALDFALNHYQVRQGAALNIVLITDEDRDNTDRSLDFNTVLASLQASNALLNVVVNHSLQDAVGQRAIGIDASGQGFLADGQGGFTTTAGFAPLSGRYSFGTTQTDYVDLALATGTNRISGAAWDLNLLRAGGTTAQSFSQAFAAIKAVEAAEQPGHGESVPEPSAIAGLAALLAIGGLGARSRQAE